MLTYSIIGQQTFAKVAFHNAYNSNANFRTFGGSLLLMIRVMTGEAWTQIMVDLDTPQPGCQVDPTYDPSYCGFHDSPTCKPLDGCPVPKASQSFFLSFEVAVANITMNLVIAIIVDAYSYEKNLYKPIESRKLGLFVDAWCNYDPNLTCYITVDDLESFIVDSDANPYALSSDLTVIKVRKRIISYGFQLHSDHNVFFEDVLKVLEAEHIAKVNGDPPLETSPILDEASHPRFKSLANLDDAYFDRKMQRRFAIPLTSGPPRSDLMPMLVQLGDRGRNLSNSIEGKGKSRLLNRGWGYGNLLSSRTEVAIVKGMTKFKSTFNRFFMLRAFAWWRANVAIENYQIRKKLFIIWPPDPYRPRRNELRSWMLSVMDAGAVIDPAMLRCDGHVVDFRDDDEWGNESEAESIYEDPGDFSDSNVSVGRTPISFNRSAFMQKGVERVISNICGIVLQYYTYNTIY